MNAGIEVFDETGGLVFDSTSRLGRILGAVPVSLSPGESGSEYNTSLGEGTPFYMLHGGGWSGLTNADPVVSFSGYRVSWRASSNNDRSWTGTIIYGVY